MSLLLTKEAWNKLKERFNKIPYFSFNDLEKNIINFIKPEDEKLSLALQKTNTIDCPFDRLNPEMLNMLFDLNERISSLEGEKKDIAQIKSDIKTLTSYMEDLLKGKKEFDEAKETFLFFDSKKIKEQMKQDAIIEQYESSKEEENIPELEVYEIEPEQESQTTS